MPRLLSLRSLAFLSSSASGPRGGVPGASQPLAGAPDLAPDAPRARRAAASPLRRTLRTSAVEGMVAEVVTACAGGAALTAWSLALGFSPWLVGLLSALPFVAQCVQFPAAWATSTFGHKRAAVWAVGLSRLVYLPLALVPWLGLGRGGQQALLLCVAALSAVLAVLGNNAWVAWMGELVPGGVRGRYFGRRSALCTLGGTLASLAAGGLLDASRRGSPHALSVLAAGAVLAGVVTTWLLLRQHDPAPGPTPVRLDLAAALLPLRHPGARKVLSFQVAWNAAVGLSAPFYALHSAQYLEMSFVLMALHAAGVAGVRMLTAPLWGRLIDRVGAQPVLVACGTGIAAIPLMWLLPTRDFLWPLLLDVVLAGALWSGHSLATFTLPLAVAPREGRAFYLAGFSTAGGLAQATGSAVGGALAMVLPATFLLGGRTWTAFHVLFVVSAVARYLSVRLAVALEEPGAERVDGLRAVLRRMRPRLGAPALAPARMPVRR